MRVCLAGGVLYVVVGVEECGDSESRYSLRFARFGNIHHVLFYVCQSIVLFIHIFERCISIRYSLG